MQSEQLHNSLGGVLITAELARRPHREPDYQAENRALTGLAEEMAQRADQVLQRVAELAMQLCRADSAGISILEPGEQGGTFRWQVAVGKFAENLHGTMPREASPCGVVLARNEALLFREPERVFPALREVEPHIYEALLAPWTIDGEPIGTLWVIHHQPTARFDSEHARLLASLARFASAAYQMVSALQFAHDGKQQLERNIEERTHALRDSEERYRALFRTMDQGFCVIEKIQTAAGEPSDFRYLAINPAFERHTGLRDPVGKTIRQLVPEAETSIMERYDRVVQTGEPDRFESHVSALDLWMEAEVFPTSTPGQIAVLFSNVSPRKRAELALCESQQRQAFLLRLTDILRSVEDPDEVKAVATRLLGEQLGVNRALYAEADREHWLVTTGYERVLEPLPSIPFRMAGYGQWIIDDFRAGRRLVVSDVRTDDRFQSSERMALAALQITGAAAVPLVKQGALIAVLTLHTTAPHDWTEQELALIEETAERTWAAVEHARAEKALRESEAQLATELADTQQLQRISRSFIEGNNIGALYDEILDVARALMRSEMASLQKLSPDRHGLFLLAQKGFMLESAKFWERVQAGHTTACGLALARGERVIVPDVEVWDFVAGTEDLAHSRLCGMRAMLSTPLISRDGRFVGIISTHWRHVHQPSERELRLLDVLARQAADLIERRSAEEALRAVEERFRLFVQNVQEYALLQTDVEGRVTSWNAGAERFFGFAAAEAMGQDFAQLTAAEDSKASALREEISRVSHGARQEQAQWLKRKDGSKFWARWVSEPIYDDSGRLVGVAKILRDETEREAAQQAIRKSLAEKEELLKEVHHRVKNNLQVITSLLNLQARQIKDPAVLTLFEESRNRVQSIASIHELLYRSDSFATIDLAAYARQIVPGLVQFYGLDGGVDVEIHGDGVALELERAVPYGLLLNELVSNACKHAFARDKSGKLAIRFGHRDGEIELRMEDDGPGLPPDFDYQRSSSLGLHLVRNLARQLRGTLEMASNKGTSVCVRFPDPSAVMEHGT